jgi:hypothetical protein
VLALRACPTETVPEIDGGDVLTGLAEVVALRVLDESPGVDEPLSEVNARIFTE